MSKLPRKLCTEFKFRANFYKHEKRHCLCLITFPNTSGQMKLLRKFTQFIIWIHTIYSIKTYYQNFLSKKISTTKSKKDNDSTSLLRTAK